MCKDGLGWSDKGPIGCIHNQYNELYFAMYVICDDCMSCLFFPISFFYVLLLSMLVYRFDWSSDCCDIFRNES